MRSDNPPWTTIAACIRSMRGGQDAYLVYALSEELRKLGFIVAPFPPSETFHEQMTDRPEGPLTDDRRDTTPAEPELADVIETLPSSKPR